MGDVSSSEPESGGGRSAGRGNKPCGVVSSYAAISLLKDNIGRRPGDKTPTERGRSITDDLSASLKQTSSKADLQQRTGVTKENALLRAELEILRQHNTDLANRLQIAENQLAHSNRQLSRSHSGLQQELGSLRDALQNADAEKTSAVTVTEGAFSQMEGIRQLLDDVLLQPDEVEAAALQCCWLAHYWELAHHFGLYPAVAASRATYWGALSPPTSAIAQSAWHIHAALQQQKEQALAGSSSYVSTGEEAATASGPEWLHSDVGKSACSMQASASDLVDLQLATRQLQELGVEAAAMAALMQQAAARRTTVQLPAAGQEGGGLVLLPVLLSAEEGRELQLQQAYLTYLWGRAAVLGVEPQVSVSRAEQWHRRMQQPPTVRGFQDVQQGFQEFRILGIEQQMWEKRHHHKNQHAVQTTPAALPGTAATARSAKEVVASTGLSAKQCSSGVATITAVSAVQPLPSANDTEHTASSSSAWDAFDEPAFGSSMPTALTASAPSSAQAAAAVADAPRSAEEASTLSMPASLPGAACSALPVSAGFRGAGLRTG